jgi:hypothetical protein
MSTVYSYESSHTSIVSLLISLAFEILRGCRYNRVLNYHLICCNIYNGVQKQSRLLRGLAAQCCAEDDYTACPAPHRHAQRNIGTQDNENVLAVELHKREREERYGT